MKILFVITRADSVGGAQAHVRDLAVALQSHGHKVLIITGKEGAYNQVLRKARIDFLSCGTLDAPIKPLQDWSSLRFILDVAKAYKPDLLSLHSSKTGVLGRVASRMLNIPCTFTAHGWSFTDGIPEPNKTIYRNIEKLTASLASKIICVSEYDRQIAIGTGMDSRRLTVVRNGVMDEAVSSTKHKQDRQAVKIAMVARFAPQKDHYTVIKAMKKLKGAELILIGDGSLSKQVETWLREFDIESRVKLLGFRNDIPAILSQVDILALISNWEGLPLSIVEGMRAGLPVVASDVGGVKEAVADGKTGYLIPRKDSETLALRLQQLVKNKELRQQMGQAGRQKYEAEFRFERMYSQTVAVYQALTRAC